MKNVEKKQCAKKVAGNMGLKPCIEQTPSEIGGA